MTKTIATLWPYLRRLLPLAALIVPQVWLAIGLQVGWAVAHQMLDMSRAEIVRMEIEAAKQPQQTNEGGS